MMQERITEAVQRALAVLLARLREEVGGALPAAIGVTAFLALITMSGVYLVTQGADQANSRDAEQVAQEAAESGLQAASAQLSEESDPSAYDGGPDDSEWSAASGGKQLDMSDAKATVSIRTVGDEFEVKSSGRSGDARRDLEAMGTPGLDSWGPLALDDSGRVGVDVDLPVNVIENDRDPDGQPLTVISNTDPERGEVECVPSGICTFYSLYEGPDSFEYTVSDPDGQQDTATVNITVERIVIDPSEPPIAVDDAGSVRRGETKTVNVLSNDIKGDGASMMLTGRGEPSAGKVSCNESGQCSYTPPSSRAVKSASFTYEIADENGPGDPEQATATIRIVDRTLTTEPPEPELPPAIEACIDKPNAAGVVGRDGNFIYEGKIGDEKLLLSGANALVKTSGGNDTVIVRSSNSVINGSAGNDLIYVNDSNSAVYGGGGNDVIVVGESNSVVDGGTGNDLICVDQGNDAVVGGSGDDVVHKRGGNASVEPGTGDDAVYINGNSRTVLDLTDRSGGDLGVVSGGKVACNLDRGDKASGCLRLPPGTDLPSAQDKLDKYKGRY